MRRHKVDTLAVNTIAEILSEPQDWSADTLDAIVDVLNAVRQRGSEAGTWGARRDVGLEGSAVPSPMSEATPDLEAMNSEVLALRALLRKVKNSVGWWAALSYIEGTHSAASRWSPDEQALLRRAFGHYVTKTGKVLTDEDIEALADEAERGYDVSQIVARPLRIRTGLDSSAEVV